jgi:hypothetical protein
MFAIFSLRRPNILPVGDLGVQRGVLRWFLSRHSSKHAFTLSPHKLSGGESNDDKTKRASTSTMGPPPTTPAPKKTPGSQRTRDVEPDNEVLPTPSESQSQTPASIQSIPAIPEPFTPSIDKTLEADAMNTEPLPEGLSVAHLKSRLEGKKIKYVIWTFLGTISHQGSPQRSTPYSERNGRFNRVLGTVSKSRCLLYVGPIRGEELGCCQHLNLDISILVYILLCDMYTSL